MKVRDIIRLIKSDGWFVTRTKGSHCQYKHPRKPGLITIAATFNKCRFGSGYVKQRFETSGIEGGPEMKRFLIVIEKAGENYSAYSPDLPGCVATGVSRKDVEKNMQEAILLHIEGLKESDLPVPKSNSFAEYMILAA